MIYLHKIEADLSMNYNDPISFSQAVSSDNSKKWLNIMKEEINFMEHNVDCLSLIAFDDCLLLSF